MYIYTYDDKVSHPSSTYTSTRTLTCASYGKSCLVLNYFHFFHECIQRQTEGWLIQYWWNMINDVTVIKMLCTFDQVSSKVNIWNGAYGFQYLS